MIGNQNNQNQPWLAVIDRVHDACSSDSLVRLTISMAGWFPDSCIIMQEFEWILARLVLARLILARLSIVHQDRGTCMTYVYVCSPTNTQSILLGFPDSCIIMHRDKSKPNKMPSLKPMQHYWRHHPASKYKVLLAWRTGPCNGPPGPLQSYSVVLQSWQQPCSLYCQICNTTLPDLWYRQTHCNTSV